MGDLKTTAEERATVRGAVGAWQHDDAISAMAALDDLDTLLAENAKLRAVRLAAREYRAMCAPGLDMCRDLARDDLDAALAALEAP